MRKTLKLVIPVVIIFAIIVLGIKCISNPQPTDFSDTIPVIENDNSTNDKKSENENSTNDKKNTADLIKFNYEFNPHVISSEIASHLTDDDIISPVFVKRIGNYQYTVENNGFGDYRVIRKRRIQNG